MTDIPDVFPHPERFRTRTAFPGHPPEPRHFRVLGIDEARARARQNLADWFADHCLEVAGHGDVV